MFQVQKKADSSAAAPSRSPGDRSQASPPPRAHHKHTPVYALATMCFKAAVVKCGPWTTGDPRNPLKGVFMFSTLEGVT